METMDDDDVEVLLFFFSFKFLFSSFKHQNDVNNNYWNCWAVCFHDYSLNRKNNSITCAQWKSVVGGEKKKNKNQIATVLCMMSTSSTSMSSTNVCVSMATVEPPKCLLRKKPFLFKTNVIVYDHEQFAKLINMFINAGHSLRNGMLNLKQE